MNLLDNGPIPFGLKGTVTGVVGNLLEVVFDEEFVGGTNLEQRFIPHRCASLASLLFLDSLQKSTTKGAQIFVGSNTSRQLQYSILAAHLVQWPKALAIMLLPHNKTPGRTKTGNV